MLRRNGIPVFYTYIGNDTKGTSLFSNQQSPLFKQKMKWKIALILRVLKLGYNVLYVDSDVILLRNPFSDLNNRMGYDLLAQKDYNSVCTGFIYILSNNRSIGLFSLAYEMVFSKELRDQQSVVEALNQMPIPTLLLPTQYYPSGSDFFRNYQYYWDMQSGKDIEEPYMLDSTYFIFHNNWVRGKFGKELRFKEMKMYHLDVDGEYSGMRKYITVERINESNLLMYG